MWDNEYQNSCDLVIDLGKAAIFIPHSNRAFIPKSRSSTPRGLPLLHGFHQVFQISDEDGMFPDLVQMMRFIIGQDFFFIAF